MKLLILQTKNKTWPRLEPLFIKACQKYQVELSQGELKEVRISKKEKVQVFIGRKDLADFDLIYLRFIGSFLEEAHWVAEYSRQKNILFFDRVYLDGRDFDRKSFECLRLAGRGVAYPPSFIGQRPYLLEKAPSLGFPLILKKTEGRKAEGVYKVGTPESLKKLIGSYQKRERLMVQKYIDNDYYLRLTVVGGEVIGAIKRNKSMDGRQKIRSEKYQPTKEQAELAVKGAQALNLDIAGIDMMIDKKDNHYILEVNRSPQYRVFMEKTGINLPEKIIEFFVKEFRKKNT